MTPLKAFTWNLFYSSRVRRLNWILPMILVASTGHSQTADTFDPAVGSSSSTFVYAVAPQPDGKVLVGGTFLSVAGQTRYFLGRLDTDGTADLSFNPVYTSISSDVRCISVQMDGKILLGGYFTQICGQPRNHIARLNGDGNLDTPFNASADSHINSIVLQPDGKILVAGTFTNLDNQTHPYLGRLQADGTLDASFNPSFDGGVSAVALQPNGAIVVGGGFSNVNGQPASGICRLNTDGTLDTNFIATANSYVWTVAVQSDGKIVAGGAFTNLDGQVAAMLGRLNPDGSLDASFSLQYNRNLSSVALQTDGKILLSGLGAAAGLVSMTNLLRLNADGTLDTNFIAATVGGVYALGLQPDGRLLVGGHLTQIGGLNRTNFGRLINTDTAAQSLSFDGSTITWMRGGTSPEIPSATFEVSIDGTNWLGVGSGTRIPGGWQLTGLSYASNINVRARGMVTGGYLNGSSWPVQTIAGPPIILTQPVSQIVLTGQVATFSVVAAGTEPLSYQWQQNGTNLPGASTASFVITNAGANNAGGYALVVSNSFGSLTSSVATLVLAGLATASSFVANVPGGTIQAIAIQPDRKVLVATADPFQPGHLARYNPDGSRDSAFYLTGNTAVNAIAIQEDLKILIGGNFNVFNGQPSAGLCRLNPDGTTDPAFTGGTGGQVFCLALQADGKIIVGGSFTNVNGQAQTNLARLNSDGTTDPSFTASVAGNVYCITIQQDGNILVGGTITSVNGHTANSLGRLHPDGTIDSTLGPNAALGTVFAVGVQLDGKIIVAGMLRAVAGLPRQLIGRINLDGTGDTTFNPAAAGSFSTGWIQALAAQADGKVLIAGNFSFSVPIPGGQSVNNLGRLNSDGSFDYAFKPLFSGSIQCLALQPDGSALLGHTIGSSGLVRVANTYASTQVQAVDNSGVTWLRGGTAPEIWRASFAASTNGVDWNNLGEGTRIAGGWRVNTASIPASATIRARGFVLGSGISGSFFESLAFLRGLSIQPTDDRFGTDSGPFGFNIIGSPAQTAIVEASGDLMSWSAIYTNASGIIPLYFSDSAWTNMPSRFYRVRSL